MTAFRRIAIQVERKPLPKFWRKKIDATQRLDATVIHWDLVSRFTTGTATHTDIWDWCETGFTYSQMFRLLAADGVEFTDEARDALDAQLGIYMDVIARYRATGRVGFNGEQLAIARAAAQVMDGLIEMDRHGIAVQAARWSVEQMAKIRRSM